MWDLPEWRSSTIENSLTRQRPTRIYTSYSHLVDPGALSSLYPIWLYENTLWPNSSVSGCVKTPPWPNSWVSGCAKTPPLAKFLGFWLCENSPLAKFVGFWLCETPPWSISWVSGFVKTPSWSISWVYGCAKLAFVKFVCFLDA